MENQTEKTEDEQPLIAHEPTDIKPGNVTPKF